MTRIIYTFLFFATVIQLSAQQESQFTHFTYNQQYYNPAFVGVRDVPSFTGIYRNQWLSFEGAPKSFQFAFNAPLFKNVGFGLSASNHKAGITNTWYTDMAYSYNLQITEKLAVRLGVQGSMKYFSINFSHESVFVLDQDDPSMADGMAANRYSGNVGGGLYLTFADNFFAGLSVPHLLRSNMGFNQTTLETAFDQPHYYLMTGAMFALDKSEKIHIKPAILAKYTEDAPFDLDINVSLMFNKELQAGLSYRLGGDGMGESVGLLLYYQLSTQLGLGVAYDFTLSDLRSYNSGTFEVLLRYDVKSEQQGLENPRFF